MGAYTFRLIRDIGAHREVLDVRGLLTDPAECLNSAIEENRRVKGKAYFAIASDHPSPSPPASKVCRHLPEPPPVIRFVIPCAISWTTISFSIAPSLRGYEGIISARHNFQRMMDTDLSQVPYKHSTGPRLTTTPSRKQSKQRT